MQHRNWIQKIRQSLEARGLPETATDDEAEAWMRSESPAILRMWDFIDVVYGEANDRGCVICATAFIDKELEAAIRKHLQAISGAGKSLLDGLLTKRPMPPLGSFAVRTKMARALGLLDDTLMDAIDSMRPMRNDAAHLSEPFSFESERYNVASLFKALSCKEQTYLGALDLVRQEDPKYPMTKRRLFELASSSIYCRLAIIATDPSFFATLTKLGSPFKNNGPYDKSYDDLMAEPMPDQSAGSSDASDSTAQI